MTGLCECGCGQVTTIAHRFVWEHFNGPIPDDMEIDHLCHDPRTCAGGPSCPHRACHEITHLSLKTHLENVRRGSKCKQVTG